LREMLAGRESWRRPARCGRKGGPRQ
jgi:hypothetical protein